MRCVGFTVSFFDPGLLRQSLVSEHLHNCRNHFQAHWLSQLATEEQQERAREKIRDTLADLAKMIVISDSGYWLLHIAQLDSIPNLSCSSGTIVIELYCFRCNMWWCVFHVIMPYVYITYIEIYMHYIYILTYIWYRSLWSRKLSHLVFNDATEVIQHDAKIIRHNTGWFNSIR